LANSNEKNMTMDLEVWMESKGSTI